MSSIRRPHPGTRVVGALRTRTAENVYNVVLGALAVTAVLLFIAGGASTSLQGLWTYGLIASAALALLFVGHHTLTRDR